MDQLLRAAEALDVAISINPSFERAHRVAATLHPRWLGELDTAAIAAAVDPALYCRRGTQAEAAGA